jgi:hypothetical protein
MEGIAAKRLEVLLDLDLDVRSRQPVAQCVAIGAELARDAGNEQSDALARHCLAPPNSICGIVLGSSLAHFHEAANVLL